MRSRHVPTPRSGHSISTGPASSGCSSPSARFLRGSAARAFNRRHLRRPFSTRRWRSGGECWREARQGDRGRRRHSAVGSGRTVPRPAGSGLHRVCGARLHEDRLEHGGAAGRSGFQRGEHRDSSCRHGSRFPPAVSPLLVHRRPGSSAHPNRGVTPREARPRPRHRDGSKNEGTSHVFPSLSLTYSPTTIAAGYSTSSSCCA